MKSELRSSSMYVKYVCPLFCTSSPWAVKLLEQVAISISTMTYKTIELGQTDLVFGLRSEFIGRCVHEGLPVSV